MNSHTGWPATTTRCVRTQDATGFVLGLLDDHEHFDYEQHLVSGCAECAGAVEESRFSVAKVDLEMARGGAGGGPSRRLRSSLLQAICEDPIEPSDIPGVFLVPSAGGVWEPTPVPGIRTKRLNLDEVNRVATSLVRMAAGARYPAHRHAGREECYVLEGEVRFSGHTLVAGDYQVAEAGSVHPEHWSPRGCLLLLVASLDDEAWKAD